VVSTIAGSESSNSLGGVAVDARGNFYVTNGYGNKILKITPSGSVSTLAGSGSHGSIDGLGTSASFSYPSGVAVDASRNIYGVDYSRMRSVINSRYIYYRSLDRKRLSIDGLRVFKEFGILHKYKLLGKIKL
jgi:hypothetical protein